MIAVRLPNAVTAPIALAAACTSAIVLLISLYAQTASLRTERDAKQELVGKLADRTARIGSAPAANIESPDLLAPTETLAAASLDANVRDVATRTALTTVETRPGRASDSADEKSDRVSVHPVHRGRIGTIQDLLFSLETELPRVRLDDVEITRSQDSSDGSEDPMLTVSLTASARWRTP